MMCANLSDALVEMDDCISARIRQQEESPGTSGCESQIRPSISQKDECPNDEGRDDAKTSRLSEQVLSSYACGNKDRLGGIG
jgi:hypothetical protein